jgi:hypothetical protein
MVLEIYVAKEGMPNFLCYRDLLIFYKEIGWDQLVFDSYTQLKEILTSKIYLNMIHHLCTTHYNWL